MSDALDDTQPKSPLKTDSQPAVQRGRSNCGCVVGALLTGAVVTVLVILALYLPPFNLYERLFGAQYAVLSAQNNAVPSPDGQLTLLVDQDDPGQDFGVALNAMPLDEFTASADPSEAWVLEARAAIPPYLALQSAVYAISTTGTPPGRIALTVNLPAGVGNTDILDLYAWDQESGRWQFVPSHPTGAGTLATTMEETPGYLALFQTAPTAPIVLAAVDVTRNLSSEVAQLATIVSPAGMQPTLEGTLAGNPAPGFTLNAGYRVMPVIRNYPDPRAIDPETVAAVLGNRSVRAEHVRQITTFAVSGGYDGVFIDYRDLAADQRANFSQFIEELHTSLSNSELLLGVVVPAASNEGGVWDTGAYDWRAIGHSADYVQINLGPDPSMFAPGESRLVEAMLRWAVGEVSRYKILMGISALSVREAGGDFTLIGYDEALSALGDVQTDVEDDPVAPGGVIRASLDGMEAEAGFDTLIQSPFVDYQAEGGDRVARMWLTTGEALRFRMDRTTGFALGGVAFDDLLANGVADDVLTSILNYKLQLPATPSGAELALRWRIESASGVVGEVTTDLNEDLVVTVEAPEGNYAINVAVVEGDAESARSGAAVAVFAPTVTPTPLPTTTPTPKPTVTPTPAPVFPTATGVRFTSGANPNPVPPPSGSIGGFEYGGHVTSTTTSAAGAMKGAGMTWMKSQFRYYRGMNPGVAADAINGAHANGFKILLGIVGVPSELRDGGAGYVSDFAHFLSGVASYGPDAIEVWNEPNLDREWPTGQISGAAYADMLAQAYQAIKSVNSGIMVISAAPAPTGAEGAYPGQVVNDNRWLSEFVQAGGLQSADCVGAHYNEGIVGPSQTSGDPRDNYYTRYFWGMVNTYWSIVGGQRKVCFTELGYLTPEGFPPLDSFFAWAQGVTLAQQAAWLAEAAALSSQSGKVGLMIIWNVDFKAYGADPQAGYAMIRPDGSCPACNALAAAR